MNIACQNILYTIIVLVRLHIIKLCACKAEKMNEATTRINMLIIIMHQIICIKRNFYRTLYFVSMDIPIIDYIEIDFFFFRRNITF